MDLPFLTRSGRPRARPLLGKLSLFAALRAFPDVSSDKHLFGGRPGLCFTQGKMKVTIGIICCSFKVVRQSTTNKICQLRRKHRFHLERFAHIGLSNRRTKIIQRRGLPTNQLSTNPGLSRDLTCARSVVLLAQKTSQFYTTARPFSST